MDKFTSFLVFDNYQIESTVFKINNNFNFSEEDISVQPKFYVEHFHSESKNQIAVLLTCEINKEDFSSGNYPFYLDMTIKGFFSIKNQEDKFPKDEKDIKSVLNVNTVAILFPYLRSAITNLTSMANIEPLILPPMNIHRLLGSE